MTIADKRRKVAAQFRRRLEAGLETKGRMKFHLGTEDYWLIYNQRLEEQGGRCAICKRDEPGGKGRWHMDHNKKTGTIRGLLCCDCNLKLGWTEANLKEITKYLRRWLLS